MDIAHFRMINYYSLNKNADVVPEQAPLIILDVKSSVCMDKNGEDTKHTRHIFIIVNFLRNGEEYNFHKTVWCDGGLQLEDVPKTRHGKEPPC